MDQHVEAHALLPADGVGDDPADGLSYAGRSISPLCSCTRSWRTSPVCGSEPVVVVGIGRQIEVGLRRAPLGSRRPGLELADRRPVRGRGDDGWRLRSAGKRIGPRRERPSLLASELEAGGQVLALDGVRQEHQAGRRNEAEGAVRACQAAQRLLNRGEVIGPHAAAVHDRHHELRLRRGGVRGGARQWQLHRHSTPSEGHGRLVGGLAELHGHDGDLRELGHAGVGGMAHGLIGLGERHPQARLVELQAEFRVRALLLRDPGPERVADLARHGHRVQPVGQPAQARQRVRPDHRPGRATTRQRLTPWQRPEGGDRRADLRDDVVVVGVEPLGHLPRLVLGGAAGQRRQGGERVGGELLLRPRRGNAQHHRRLQHRVVQEVVVRGGAGQLLLLGQVRGPQLGNARVEGLPVETTRPGALKGPLQLTAGTDARIADQLGDDRHVLGS